MSEGEKKELKLGPLLRTIKLSGILDMTMAASRRWSLSTKPFVVVSGYCRFSRAEALSCG